MSATFIEGMDFTEYTLEDAVNNSALNAFSKSPAHYKRYLDRLDERGDTPALQLGRAVHCLALEPDDFNNRYVKSPDCRRGTNEWKGLCALHPGKEILKPAEYEEVFSIGSAIRTHPEAAKLLDGGLSEVTLVWDDKATGMKCKARLDGWNQKLGAIVDIKTCQDASPHSFAAALEERKYRRQGAWYETGAREVGLQVKDVYFIAVEKEPPYYVAVYRLSREVIELSKLENAELLSRIKAHHQANYWPGYTEGSPVIGIPDYAMRKLEERYGESL